MLELLWYINPNFPTPIRKISKSHNKFVLFEKFEFFSRKLIRHKSRINFRNPRIQTSNHPFKPKFSTHSNLLNRDHSLVSFATPFLKNSSLAFLEKKKKKITENYGARKERSQQLRQPLDTIKPQPHKLRLITANNWLFTRVKITKKLHHALRGKKKIKNVADFSRRAASTSAHKKPNLRMKVIEARPLGVTEWCTLYDN